MNTPAPHPSAPGVTISARCPRCCADERPTPRPDPHCDRCGGLGIVLLRVRPEDAALDERELALRYPPRPAADVREPTTKPDDELSS